MVVGGWLGGCVREHVYVGACEWRGQGGIQAPVSLSPPFQKEPSFTEGRVRPKIDQ